MHDKNTGVTEEKEPAASAPPIQPPRETQRGGGFRVFRLVLFLLFLLAVAVMAVYAAWHVVKTDATVARVVRAPIPVEAAPAKVMTLEETVGASGSVHPNDTVNVFARIAAQITKVPVDLGAIVKAH